MIKVQLQQDLKEALLARDSFRATVVRGLKSAILYEEVATGKRDEGLSEAATITILQREHKKRIESAEQYASLNAHERADQERAEAKIISAYLPAQLSESDIAKLVDEAVHTVGGLTTQTMGQVIGFVKQKSAGAADGATIARLVKARLAA